LNIANILSAISLALCCFFFLYFRSFIKRRTSAGELLAEYRSEVLRLNAEIDAVTDRDALLVEERIKTLKVLLDDTDKRIAVYLRELERSRSGEALYSSLGRGIRAAPGPAVLPAPPETSSVQTRPADFAAPGAPPAGPPESPPDESAPGHTAKAGEKQASPPAPAAKPRLKEQITGLAAGGLPPAEIASRLGLSLSEVDLALSLLGRGAG
jgi:DNA-binding transcriptional ArsR family regulator